MQITITTTETYELKWQFTFDNNYKVSICKKIINTKTNKVLNETLNSSTFGYWFGKKFIAKKRLNDYLEKIPND